MVLIAVSPAKSLAPDRARDLARTHPVFDAEAQRLAACVAGVGQERIARMMDLSDTLAARTYRQLGAIDPEMPLRARCAAGWMFDGDVYATLDISTLSADMHGAAQSRLRILSGLYGVLRPFDGIQPYRLEMGRRLPDGPVATLYEFWGDRIATHLAGEAVAQGSVVLDLASREYGRVLDPLPGHVRRIVPRFEEMRGGRRKVVSFTAKRARGAMARWCLDTPQAGPDDLREFSWNGYAFDPEMSTPDAPCFLRAPG